MRINNLPFCPNPSPNLTGVTLSLSLSQSHTLQKSHTTPLHILSAMVTHKYKCLWGMGGKGRGSSLQEGASHTYTIRLI